MCIIDSISPSGRPLNSIRHHQIPVVLPGEGIGVLIGRIPEIEYQDTEEALRLFSEVMREWIYGSFWWVKSVVMEGIVMRELDEHLAGCLL